MWELVYIEIWLLKNWCFWTVVLEKTLESSLDCKEVQPVHAKEDQSWVFTKGLILKLKLQYFGHLLWRADSFEKTLMLEKIEGGRKGQGWGGWTASSTQCTWVWADSRIWWWTGKPGMLLFMLFMNMLLHVRKASDTTEWTELKLQQIVLIRLEKKMLNCQR